MNNFSSMNAGFGDMEDAEPDDVIGNYTGMRCCVGYVGNEPQFLDPKELSAENVEKACAFLKLDQSALSYAHLAQAVMKWINAGRPENPVIKNEEEITLRDFF